MDSRSGTLEALDRPIVEPDAIAWLRSTAVASVPEVGRRVFGVSRNTAYEAAKVGQIPTLRIGRRLVVPTHQLLRLLGCEEVVGGEH